MKTIEERAEEATNLFSFRNGYQGAKEAYIKGATDQRIIDIDKAVKWFEKKRFVPLLIDDFCKAMME